MDINQIEVHFLERESATGSRGPAPRAVQYCIMPNGCWKVLNMCSSHGHPIIVYKGITMPLRRFAYVKVTGQSLSARDTLIATCGNKWCINPKHMELKGRSDVE